MEGKQSLQQIIFRKCKNRSSRGFTSQAKTWSTWDRVSSKCNQTDENTPSGTRGTFTHCEFSSAAVLVLSPHSVSVWLAASSLPSSLHEFRILKLPKFPCFPQMSSLRSLTTKTNGKWTTFSNGTGATCVVSGCYRLPRDWKSDFQYMARAKAGESKCLLHCVSMGLCRTHSLPMSLPSGVQLEHLLLGW